MANGTMTQQVTPQQQNIMARQAVIRQSVDMWLPIFSRSYTATNNQGPGTTENIPLRNVGLIKRLLIEINAQITPGATTLTLTNNGVANFLSNVTFTDLSNQTRINTTGWHLYAVSTAKRRRVYGGSYSFSNWPLMPIGAAPVPANFPTGYGTTQGPIYGDSPIPTANVGTVEMYYEVPFSYTDHDLRGAIYANVTNATMNLQFTVNPQFFTNSANTFAVQNGVYYSSDGSGTLTSFTVTVYQNFLDQLPIAQQGGPVLPLLDLSTAYLLNNTAVSGIVANQDNPIPFANFRDFMSFIFIYNDPGMTPGHTQQMINYLSLQSANYTNIFKLIARTNYLMSRLIIGNDFPLNMFYFDFRHKPISTIQFGNMEMIINPAIVTGANSSFLTGFESLALINMITQAGSLYGS
jgi:hypothetical protein